MVRHGESTANAALAAALQVEAEEFDKGTRDPDVGMSARGHTQAAALRTWLATQPPPTAILSSPYRRARETAEIALHDLPVPRVRLDERLRDRDTGILHGLTALGVRRRHPAEHRERERLGRFYYRPPGGESWPDVALRLRPLLPELTGHTLIFTHDIVIVMTRYILANLTEPEILKIESTQLANASITRWERNSSGLRLTTYNDTAHLRPLPPQLLS
ncbi:histidine phosphatase family protein [Nocardia sp. IFM 10818]